MERRVIDGYHEEILARLDHFCGIYGALSSGRLASDRQRVASLKPGSHLCDKHNTSDISTSISTSISTRKKKHVPFFLCLCLCLCRLCYACRTSVNQA